MTPTTWIENFSIREAVVEDVPVILDFIGKLAEYEKLSHEVTATEERLKQNLFGKRRVAEVLLGFEKAEPVGFALFFHNFSTFLARPGIYIEDLYVLPDRRSRGYGTAMLVHIAKIAEKRKCGRLEWSVLDWNAPAIRIYLGIGAQPLADWTIYRLTGETLQRLAARSPDSDTS